MKTYSYVEPGLSTKILMDGVLYDNAKLAAKKLNMHPTSVRRKCKSPDFENWRYI